jgi:inhibitor of cysteine peptidase
VAEIEISGPGDEQSAAAVEVGVGDEVVIRLPENATTGYVWSVQSIDHGLELVEDAMLPAGGTAGEAAGPPPPGAGGQHVVRLRATAPARAEVVLHLGRSWEPAPAQQRRVTVTVRR